MTTLFLYQHCAMTETVHVLQEGRDAVTAQTMDLSDALMRIRSEEPITPGSPIQLGLHFLRSDATTEDLQVQGVVLNRFREPEGDHWQVGIQLQFEDAAQERSVLGYLSSCQGLF